MRKYQFTVRRVLCTHACHPSFQPIRQFSVTLMYAVGADDEYA